MTERPHPAEDLGIVEPQRMRFDAPFTLECGVELPEHELCYETYGRLDAKRSNAVLICHALSGDHHAAGYHGEGGGGGGGVGDGGDCGERRPGWWNHCIGPGKPIDTERFFVVCPNNLGGCAGSTGPTSPKPDGSGVYGPDFPPLEVADWVRSQALLADALGIDCWAAVVGGSLGGMQALAWALMFPERLRHSVAIAAALRLTSQNIAFNEVARQAIRSDPDFCAGRYLEQGRNPIGGLSIARMVGHITYLSDVGMTRRFGRGLQDDENDARDDDVRPLFQVESYLRHQGEAFSSHFDANTYLLVTQMLDHFDLAAPYGNDPVAAFRKARCRFLVVSFSSDWRFAPPRSREIVRALIAARQAVSYAEIKADQGHDAFLLPIPRYREVLGAYFRRIWQA